MKRNAEELESLSSAMATLPESVLKGLTDKARGARRTAAKHVLGRIRCTPG